MTELESKQLYSYRDDPAVPSFAEDKALFIFDGICILCSTGCAWMMRRDLKDQLRFSTTTTPLGAALFRHYGVDANATYMLIDQGRMYTKSDGYLHLLDRFGGAWVLLKILYLIPRRVRDYVYDVITRHRYQWFGTSDYCALIPEEYRKKML